MCKDVYLGLLAYRSTPLECGQSPAELLFARKVRSVVPELEELRRPKWGTPQIDAKNRQLKERQWRNYNDRHGVRGLTPLRQGQCVYMPDRQAFGAVRAKAQEPRSYQVVSNGAELRRNRRQLIAGGKAPVTRGSVDKDVSNTTREMGGRLGERKDT